MEHFNWELSVLSRAVAYQNLSGASQHVGLSQPQLSRIIQKLEAQWSVVLLDRSAKRKACWTSAAYKLARVYSEMEKKLQNEITQIATGTIPQHLRVGTLEGLLELSHEFCHRMMIEEKISIVELNIHDLDYLEEAFFKGDYDLIFTIQEPGRKKFQYLKRLGFQGIENYKEAAPSVFVQSSFEFQTQPRSTKKLSDRKFFVSNSLNARKLWLTQYGGVGRLPSPVSKNRPDTKECFQLMLIGSENLSPVLWQKALEKIS